MLNVVILINGIKLINEIRRSVGVSKYWFIPDETAYISLVQHQQ